MTALTPPIIIPVTVEAPPRASLAIHQRDDLDADEMTPCVGKNELLERRDVNGHPSTGQRRQTAIVVSARNRIGWCMRPVQVVEPIRFRS